MRSIGSHLKRRFIRQNQVGQAIILMAFAMIMLLAFVGLVTDVGLLMVRYSQLRRAVDSASIAAAGQVRENRDYADIALTARQFIRLHGMDPSRVSVETCVTTITAADPDGDPELCGEPGESPRKLVRITAQVDSPTTFLQLIGWDNVILEASAVAETAVIDVALVLDISESMASATKHDAPGPSDYDAIFSGGGGVPQPSCVDNENHWQYAGCCNDPGTGTVDLNGNISMSSNVADGDFSDLICQPFKQARDAARTFIQRLDFVRGDRVVLVTFGEDGAYYSPDNPNPGLPATLPPLISDESIAITTLNEKVGVFDDSTGETGGCRTIPSLGTDWVLYEYDFIAPCPDTNLGGGILAANSILTDPTYVRREAVWVMIVLSDGAASTTNRATYDQVEIADNSQGDPMGDYGHAGYCPWYAFCDRDNPITGTGDEFPECQGSPTRPDPFPHIGIHEPDPHDPPFCSDPDPYTRHWCLTTSADGPALAPGVPDMAAINCDTNNYADYGTVAHTYDPIDFAMDMADFAGLIEVQTNVPGNFIAMYTIGFIAPPDPAKNSELVSAALGEYTLRYIADAGDNGVIDNNYQQDCRDDFTCGDDYGALGLPAPYPAAPPNGLFYNPHDYPDEFGPPGPCEVDANTGQVFVPGDFEDCGQYWYAEQGTNDLDRIFAEIASRLFTRLAR